MEEKREDIDKKIETRKEKIKNFLTNKENFLLILILIMALVVRLYYFLLTKNQPLWWDEAEYMSYAKGFAGIIDLKGSWGYRLPGFPLLASLFFIIGIRSDAILRFFLAFIPSLLVIILTYLMIKEMYKDKKIALISTAIITVLWEHLFYSNRFHTENLSLIFQFLAIFIFFRVWLNKKDFYFIKPKYSLIWIIFFCLLSLFFRPGNLLFIPSIFLFFILLNYSKIFKKKNIIYLILASIIIIISLLIFINLPKEGLLTAFHSEYPLAWNVINIFKGTDVFTGFYKPLIPNFPSLFLYFFFIGIAFFLIDLIIFPEKIKKLKPNEEDLDFKSDIYNFLLIISVLLFFILILRPQSIEYRWFFPLLPGMLAFTSLGILKTSNYIGTFLNIKYLAFLLIITFTILGLYTQINHADLIIKNKLDSYLPVKESGLWMKDNSEPGNRIISASYYQHYYYSERTIKSFLDNETDFNNLIKEARPEYIVVSVFEPMPKWVYDWPQRNNNTVFPVKAYFADPEQKQLALVIYKTNY